MQRVMVYGAYGHTGRFVLAELLSRGVSVALGGRDSRRLSELGEQFSVTDLRAAAVSDRRALASAMDGIAAVVNCAGPFLDTALPIARAAVAAGAHYLDVSAEQAAVLEMYSAARGENWPMSTAVVPAMAFFGGLPDLLATAAMGQWDRADEVTVAIGVDRWWPTHGTRATGRRNTAERLIVEEGRLVGIPREREKRDWVFPPPLGRRGVTDLPFSEVITLHSHLRIDRVRTYLSASALEDIRDSETPPPAAIDDLGRSEQVFTVEVVVRRGTEQRRYGASGRDIYFSTGPLVATAVMHLLNDRATVRGASAPGATFDAPQMLADLRARHFKVWSGSADDEGAPTATEARSGSTRRA